MEARTEAAVVVEAQVVAVVMEAQVAAVVVEAPAEAAVEVLKLWTTLRVPFVAQWEGGGTKESKHEKVLVVRCVNERIVQ